MKASVPLALTSIFPQIASAVVQFPFAKQKTRSYNNTGTDSTRRSINAALSYLDSTYVVNVTVGTPGQPVSLQLSASSSDTWVVDARSEYCTYSYGYYGYEDDYNTTETQYCVWGTCKSGPGSTRSSLKSSS